jgi:hypothetical protein
MSDPEAADLRKALAELSDREWSHHHDHTGQIGNLQGRLGVDERRLEAVERRLDDLLFLLLKRQSGTASHDSHRPPTEAKPSPPPAADSE